MSFRQVYIKECLKISLNDNSLLVKKKNEEEVLIPINDIDSVFIEEPNCVITSRVISKLTEQNVAIIHCDKNFNPCALTTKLYGQHNQINLLYNQLDLLASKKNKLWEILLKRKIENHIYVVKNIGCDNNVKDKLFDFYEQVKSDDKNFIEGVEAKIYFKAVFGSKFIRFEEDGTNAALNYGYSIINGEIVRVLVACGLNPMIGLHHRSKENFYNLASDFIEPYRAFIDYFVYQNRLDLTVPLTFEIRKRLIDILNMNVIINDKIYTLSKSISITVYSFINYMESGNISNLKLVSFYDSDK